MYWRATHNSIYFKVTVLIQLSGHNDGNAASEDSGFRSVTFLCLVSKSNSGSRKHEISVCANQSNSLCVHSQCSLTMCNGFHGDGTMPSFLCEEADRRSPPRLPLPKTLLCGVGRLSSWPVVEASDYSTGILLSWRLAFTALIWRESRSIRSKVQTCAHTSPKGSHSVNVLTLQPEVSLEQDGLYSLFRQRLWGSWRRTQVTRLLPCSSLHQESWTPSLWLVIYLL